MAEWYTKIAEQVVGPLSAEQLKALAAGGRLAPVDPVAQSAEGPWVPASRVKGLFEVAAIDDEPEEEIPPVDRPVDEPPIPQPPVVMSSQTAAQAPPSQPAPRAEAAPPSVDSPPAGGFAIQTEEVAATERFQKKRRSKEPRQPLTKKQKNARTVKRLAIAIVAGIVVLVSIPFVRTFTRSPAEPVATKNPVAADVDLAVTGDGLDDAFHSSSSAARSRPMSSAAGRSDGSDARSPVEPMEMGSAAEGDVVEVKKVRYVLDRPRMVSDDGRAARPANRVLLVELDLNTKVADVSPRFRGWTGYTEEISLTDGRAFEYKVWTPQDFRDMYVEGQCRETTFLSSEKPTTDVIVFTWPEDEAPDLPTSSGETLKLRLPKAAYGEQGELQIAIPLSEIEVTEAAMKQLRGGPPAAKGGTSDNVRVDDGGAIPIPGLTD